MVQKYQKKLLIICLPTIILLSYALIIGHQVEAYSDLDSIDQVQILSNLTLEETKLTASDAGDGDQFGTSISFSGNTLVVGAPYENNGRGAAFVFKQNQGGNDNWGEVTKLIASDPEDFDWFGKAVAMDGNTIVVGAYGEDGSGYDFGAVYIYEYNQNGDNNWNFTKKIIASDRDNEDIFGLSVAIDGEQIIVGSPYKSGDGIKRGSVYVFSRNLGGANNWGEMTKLSASDAEDYDIFGTAVAVNNDTIVVGAPQKNGAGTDRGEAYIFNRNIGGEDNWGEVAKLIASNPDDNALFGASVSIYGTTTIVGAFMENGTGLDNGAAYIFEQNYQDLEVWEEAARLISSDNDFQDYFGRSVAIFEDNVVVGAYGSDYEDISSGAAYIFGRNKGGENEWGEVSKLIASDAASNDENGTAVSIYGEIVVTGAPKEDGEGDNSGAAFIYYLDQNLKVYLPLVAVNN